MSKHRIDRLAPVNTLTVDGLRRRLQIDRHPSRRGAHVGRSNAGKIRRRLLLESMLPPGVEPTPANVVAYYGMPSDW